MFNFRKKVSEKRGILGITGGSFFANIPSEYLNKNDLYRIIDGQLVEIPGGGMPNVGEFVKGSVDKPFEFGKNIYEFQQVGVEFKLASIPKKLEDENLNLSEIFEKTYEKYGFKDSIDIVNSREYNVKTGKVIGRKIIIYYWTTESRYNYLILNKKNITEEEIGELKDILVSFNEKPIEINDEISLNLVDTVEEGNIKFKVPEGTNVDEYDEDEESIEFVIDTNKEFLVDVYIDYDYEFFNKTTDIDGIKKTYNFVEIEKVSDFNDIEIYNCRRTIGDRRVAIVSKKEWDSKSIGIIILIKNSKYNEEKHKYLLDLIDSIEESN